VNHTDVALLVHVFCANRTTGISTSVVLIFCTRTFQINGAVLNPFYDLVYYSSFKPFLFTGLLFQFETIPVSGSPH
jgi:hypothetical protein